LIQAAYTNSTLHTETDTPVAEYRYDGLGRSRQGRLKVATGREPVGSEVLPLLVFFLRFKPRQGRLNGIQSPLPGLEKEQEGGFRASAYPGLAAGARAQSCLRHWGRNGLSLKGRNNDNG
jgi:hypothetical protein